jgi:hypothetical protein
MFGEMKFECLGDDPDLFANGFVLEIEPWRIGRGELARNIEIGEEQRAAGTERGEQGFNKRRRTARQTADALERRVDKQRVAGIDAEVAQIRDDTFDMFLFFHSSLFCVDARRF